MSFSYDHDLHIHSRLSVCSQDDGQTTARILSYARANRLHTVCLTDHFWDEKFPMNSRFYREQGFAHICEALPLPKDSDVRFLFGCETELDRNGVIGIAPEHYDTFDFIIVPTTHMHMGEVVIDAKKYETLEQRATAWVERIDTVLSSDLPLEKVGLAHLTSSLILRGDRAGWLATLEALDEREMRRLFTLAAARGVGIELNAHGFDESEEALVLRPFRIAHECGCRFYFGLDAHTTHELDDAPEKARRLISYLSLEESDKHPIARDPRHA